MRKLVGAVGATTVIVLMAALPVSAVVTDAIADAKGDAGQAWFKADDKSDGSNGAGSDGVAADKRGGGVPDSATTISPAAGQAKPLTEAQKRRVAAGTGACVGAKVASRTAVAVCYGSVPTAATAPVGEPGRPAVSVASVRQEAVDQITLTKPDLQASQCLADPGSCKGTVGVPVWLWVGDGNGVMPSESASATAGRFSIKATAKVSKVKRSLGDGQTTVCSGTGTRYSQAEHGWSAPDCGFEHGWKKAGTYTLTASFVWDISWSGDQAGSATQTRSSTQRVTVGELQSVATQN